jgi:glycosyltransferase involved in cell wall biosynthesis
MLSRETPAPVLTYEHVYCVSAGTRDALLEAGIPVAHARDIHTGLDYPAGEPRLPAGGGDASDRGPLKLLYAGRLSVEKGVDTAIRAVAELDGFSGGAGNPVHLSIAGDGRRRYVAELHRLVKELEVEAAVTFLGRRPPGEMPAVMASSDVLVVPSRWPEPFARVVLEGMHSRLAILATPVGGSKEVVEDGLNGFFFPADDSVELAARIRMLIDDPSRRQALAEAGWETVTGRFSRKAMLDQIETFLAGAAAGPRSS